MNAKLRNILNSMYDYAERGWDKEDVMRAVENSLRDLVSEMVSRPIHEAAKRAGDLELEAEVGSFGRDYYNGVWNSLYWALGKIDKLFGEE